VTRASCVSNQASKEAFVGKEGGGGINNSFRAGERESQSVRDQLATGGGGEEIGRAKVREIGTWFEPVEGRGVSHEQKKGNKSGHANERSITEGRVALSQGKRVNTPGRLRSSKPRSAALGQ